MISLEELILFLGLEGARAGLENSDITVAELLKLEGAESIPNASKQKRSDIINLLLANARKKTTKTIDQLMEMDAEALKQYFHDVKASRGEILEVLLKLDIRPGSAAKKNLVDYAAQEISDIGMYRRVAQGKSGGVPPDMTK